MINSITELPVLARKTEELAQEWELPVSLTMNISLVLEEAFSNIIYYAFNDDGYTKSGLQYRSETISLLSELRTTAFLLTQLLRGNPILHCLPWNVL